MHHPHFHFHVSPSQNAVQRPYLPYSEPSYNHQPHSPVRLQPYTRYLRQLDDSPPFDPSYSPCTYRNQAQNYQQRFQQQNYPNYQGAQYQNYHQTSNANDYYPPYWNQHGTGQFQSCQFAGVNTNYSQSYNNQQHAYSTNQGYGHYPYTNSTNYQHQYQPHQFYPDINPIIPPNDHSFRPPSTCPLNTLTQFAKEPEKYVPRLRKNNNRSIQSSNDLLKQAWDLAMQATEPQDRQEEIDVPEVKFPFEVSKEANSLVDAYEQFVEKNGLKDELLDCIDHGTTTVVPIVDADSRSDTASPGIPILQAAEMAELLDTKEAHRPDPMKFLKFDSDKKQNEEIDDITQNVMKAAEDASVGAVISSRISALTSSPRSKISTRSSPRKTDRQLSAPEEPGPSSAHNSLCKSEVVSETPTTPERKSTRSTPVGSPGGYSEEMGFSATRRGRYKKTVTLPAWYKSPERKAVEERSIASTTETTLAEAASVLNGHNNETRQEIEGTPEENSQKTETESVETPEKVKVYATVEDLLKNLPTNVTRQENAKVPVIRLKKSKSPKRKSKSAASTPAKRLRRLSEDTSQDYLWETEPLVSPLAVKEDEEKGDTSQETVIYDWEKEPDSFIKEMQENKAHKFQEAEEEQEIDDKFELVQNEDAAEKSNEVENDESEKPEEKVKNPGKEEEQEMEEMVENPKPNPVLLSLIERMQQRIPSTSTSEPPEIEESSGDTSQEIEEEMSEEEMAELLLEDSSSSSSSSSDEMDESFEDAAESCLATEHDGAVLSGTSMKVVDDAAETEKKDGEMDKTVSTPTFEKSESETAAKLDTAEPSILSEVPTTPKVTDPSPRKTKRRSLEVRLGTPIDDDPFSRENLFMKMEKFYADLKAEVNASEEWKVKQKAKSETQETDVAMGEPDAPSNSKVCDSAPKTDLVSFEKTTTDKKSAFVSTELDSFLTMSAALKNHFLKTDEKLNPKDKPEKYYPRGPEVQSTCDEVRPDIDMIDSMLFLAFGSEETLGTHTSLEMDHDLKAKHVDVFQRFRYLHRPEAAEKGDAYLRSVRKKVKRYEKTLQKEAKKVTKSKQIVDQSIEPSKILLQKTSDPTKVKGWKGKFGFISNIGGVDVYRYHNGQVHWRTENRLMKTLSPTRVRNLGLALKRRRRRSPILSHKKNKGKSPSASEQIRAWKSKIKPKPKTIPKPGESLSNRPRLWVNDALDDDDIPNVDEVDKILKFAIQDFQDRQPSRKVPRVSTSHLKCQVLSSDKARAAVRTLKVLSQGPHGPELVGSEDECDKPGCRYGCVCHLCGPDESTEETKAKSECEKEYCRLGCICASLNASAKPRNSCHHKTTRCRFRCKCKEDDFKPDLSLPRLRDKRRPSMMASKFKDMISWDRLHGSGVEKNPRRRERDRTRKPAPQVTLPPPPERLKMIPEESVPQYTVYTPDPEYRPPRAKPSTKARGPASTDPATQAKAEDERKRKKKLQRVINKGAKTKQSVEAYRALTGRKKSQPGRREEEEEEEVEDDGPSSCMRTSLYTAKHMRCRCQQETFYTNCQSLRCLHIQLRENLRTKRQGVPPKPLSEQVAENERGILQARNRLRMEEYARKVREAQEAADKTAAKGPKTATEPPKKSSWTTQMMLLQPKRKQEEAGTCRPQLLEIKSCCQWEAIRLQILGYVAQKLKSHEYPPVSRVAIGQFIVEILPKCDKPTKIPPHLRSALPELMFAIRIAIKPIVTASDVMGVHRPDFSHLGKLSQEEDDKKSDDLGVQEDKKSERSDDLVPRRISTGSRVSMDSRSSTPRADNIFEAMSCDSDDCQIVEKSEKSPKKVMEIDLTAEDDPEPEVKMEVEDKKPDVLPEVKLESVEDPDAELDTFMREVNPHTIDTKNFPELPVLVRQAMTNKLWSLIANSVEEAREFQILSKIKHARFPETQVFLQVVCTKEEYENECQQSTLPDNDVQCEIVEMVPKERKILFVKTEPLEKKTIELNETKTIEPVEKKPSAELKPEIKTASSRRKSPVVAKDEMPELVREDHDEKPSVPSESSATPILSTILTSPPDISPPPVLQHKDSPYNPAAETHQTSSKRSRRKEKLETRTMKDELEVVPIADLKKPKKIVKAEPDIVEVPMYEPRDRVHPSLAKLMVPGHRWTRMDRVDTNGMVDVEMTPEEVRVKREVVYLEEVRPEEDDLDQIIDILALDEDDPLDAPPGGAGGNDTTLPILDGVKNVRERYRRKMMALSMNHLREQVYEKDDPLRRQKMSRSKVASVVDAISLIKELKEAEMKLMVYKEKSLRRLMGYISVKMAKEGKSLPAQEELKRLAVTRLGRKFLEAPSSVLSFERYCDKYACQDHPIERILRNEQRVMERLTHDWEEKRRLDNTKLVKGEQSPVYELLGLGNGDQVDAAYPGLIVHKDIPRREMRPEEKQYYMSRSKQICDTMKGQMRSLLPAGVVMKENGDGSTVTVSRTFTKLEPKLATATSGPGSPKTVRTASPRILSGSASSSSSGGSLIVKSIRPPAANVVLGGLGALSTPVTSDTSTQVVNVIAKPTSSSADVHVVRRGNSPANNFGLASLRPVATATTTGLSAVTSTAQTGPGTRLVTTAAIRPGDGKSHTTTNLTFVVPNKQVRGAPSQSKSETAPGLLKNTLVFRTPAPGKNVTFVNSVNTAPTGATMLKPARVTGPASGMNMNNVLLVPDKSVPNSGLMFVPLTEKQVQSNNKSILVPVNLVKSGSALPGVKRPNSPAVSDIPAKIQRTVPQTITQTLAHYKRPNSPASAAENTGNKNMAAATGPTAPARTETTSMTLSVGAGVDFLNLNPTGPKIIAVSSRDSGKVNGESGAQ